MATNSTVQTVTGPVDAAELGRTLVHEHIRISYWGEEYDRGEGWNRAETVAIAVDKMTELLDAGFRTFVDPCPIELGRDPELYAEIAQRSGMNIVCTTGFYTEHMGWGLPVYWRARDPEEVAEHYVAELTEGIAGTGGIRPGAIKAATGLDVTDAERRMLTGAALAQHETSVAIITHTENSRHGDVQQDIFESGGAELGRVLIGHQDEQEDVAPIRKLAERGTFVGIDRIGLEILAPDVRRADHVATLVREGFTNQVCLSQDHICALTAPRSIMWTPPEARARRAEMAEAIAWQVTKRPYTYIVTDFVPMLKERGVTDADVERIFVDNPRRLLAGA
jgi:phosphotriesterase-related protein